LSGPGGQLRRGANNQVAHCLLGECLIGLRVFGPREFEMGLILAILILALLFGVGGFAVHLLWIVAGIVLLVWVIGFFARGSSGGRWYRW